MNLDKQENISVSQYLDLLNSKLKTEKAKIVGEISGVQEYPGRSYLYFSLKDSNDQSTVKCFMWKKDYSISGVKLEEGLEVVVKAYPNIYKPNGSLTLQVEQIELVGEGALKKAYDELKNKLEKEGIFSTERKRSLPMYPHKIGVITSKNGAVINDFLTNIGKYGFEILFVDSKVEGGDSIYDLLNSIETLKNKNLDVLVIMRGGGSLESFMAFNNETLVRAVASFPVPVITGIGHDKDISLVSLVSDVNVSTPTAVAHYLNKNWDDVVSYITLSEEKIFSIYNSTIQNTKFNIEHTSIVFEQKFSKLFEAFYKLENVIISSVSRLESIIMFNYEQIKNSDILIKRIMSDMVSKLYEKLKQTENLLAISSPERQLKKGYSIVRRNGKIVKSTKDIEKDTDIDIMVSDGIIKSKTL